MSRRDLVRAPGLAAHLAALRSRADQVFSRSTGAPVIAGNRVRILRDGAENYPAWEQAIRDAEHSIHIEMYIIHRDRVGRRFIDLLAARAREGVQVRLLYDWFGCGISPLTGLFRPLIGAGGEVRVFNPPTLRSPLGWTRRNHRKFISVDGRTLFVAGLCMGRMWEGQPGKRHDPWRDTGVEIVGPATAHGERGFADSWRLAGGGEIQPSVMLDERAIPAAGQVNLRLIYTEPFVASMLRVDLLVAAMARHRLWIADAYFIGHGPYVQALQAAAEDGVDVRLLLPQGSDVGWTVPVSRTLYRTLLDSGVRIFEWNGAMMHAKTAVADSHWARVGSTNLNLNSWVGNWELDVTIEDVGIARTLESHFEEDLARSTEIVQTSRRRHAAAPVRHRARRSARRALRTASTVGHSVSAAVLGSRQLAEWEAAPLLASGVAIAALAGVAFWSPRTLAWPAAAILAWVAIAFLWEGVSLWRSRRSR